MGGTWVGNTHQALAPDLANNIAAGEGRVDLIWRQRLWRGGVCFGVRQNAIGLWRSRSVCQGSRGWANWSPLLTSQHSPPQPSSSRPTRSSPHGTRWSLGASILVIWRPSRSGPTSAASLRVRSCTVQTSVCSSPQHSASVSPRSLPPLTPSQHSLSRFRDPKVHPLNYAVFEHWSAVLWLLTLDSARFAR